MGFITNIARGIVERDMRKQVRALKDEIGQKECIEKDGWEIRELRRVNNDLNQRITAIEKHLGIKLIKTYEQYQAMTPEQAKKYYQENGYATTNCGETACC